MSWILRFIYAAIGLSIVLLGVLISVNNSQLARVDLYWWQAPELPLGSVILIMLLIGAVLGILASSAVVWRTRRQNKYLQKQMKSVQARLDHLG
ncbi:LapA family protein [Bermanella marisrubri]|uniref:Exonuclease IX n=1 Tax=Bermanella marisrubri TaxID=207949 RepID=Q1N616_9GAMM|nr:LapA family protein [Bermanella marisrubri]EAT13776.1 exonuclease IX [Oceanobacter sp. RED65] [Bermanella marisrubri]QIZ84546.1 LapA family protein [Bermanella marisrubri]